METEPNWRYAGMWTLRNDAYKRSDGCTVPTEDVRAEMAKRLGRDPSEVSRDEWGPVEEAVMEGYDRAIEQSRAIDARIVAEMEEDRFLRRQG